MTARTRPGKRFSRRYTFSASGPRKATASSGPTPRRTTLRVSPRSSWLKTATRRNLPYQTMRVSLSYPDVPPFEIPDSSLLACLEPRTLEPSRPVAELVEHALDHPIGSPPVEAYVSHRTRVVMLVDDITRQ